MIPDGPQNIKASVFFQRNFHQFFSKLEELETGRDEKLETRQGALHLRHTVGNAMFISLLYISRDYFKVLSYFRASHPDATECQHWPIGSQESRIATFVKPLKTTVNVQNEWWDALGEICLHSLLGLPYPIPWQLLWRTKFTIFQHVLSPPQRNETTINKSHISVWNKAWSTL